MSTSAAACSDSGDFEFLCRSQAQRQWILQADPYSAAMAFVRGEFSVAGNLVEAVRKQLHSGARHWRTRLFNLAARAAPWRTIQRWERRRRTKHDIQFHYDRSNEFYRLFLDKAMVYSCAYFERPEIPLEEAQKAKLEHICRKLRLHRGESFLDIGCGWGALVMHAASNYKTISTGCTLSAHQAQLARSEIRHRKLEPYAQIAEQDYREIISKFDKIASVGMVEHVGHARIREYFRKVYSLLATDGLFLNHGITMPASAHHDAQGVFIARRVFPGGEILRLSDMIAAAEREGFAVLDVEELRPHYALTCRTWLNRLRAHEEQCLALVGPETLRTWEIYLAGCVVAFEEGGLDIHQILLGRQGRQPVPFTRRDLYETQAIKG